jgi:hypothetical protein
MSNYRIARVEGNVITVNFCPAYTLAEAEKLLGEEFALAMTEWSLEKLQAEANRWASDPMCDAYDAYMAVYKFRTRDLSPAPDNVVPLPTRRRAAA